MRLGEKGFGGFVDYGIGMRYDYELRSA